MVFRKGNMLFRMPVLCQHNRIELLRQLINQWNNLVRIGDRQITARRKAILDIDHDQCAMSGMFLHFIIQP